MSDSVGSHEESVKGFVSRFGGRFVVVSHDMPLIKTMRALLYKYLSLPQSSLAAYQDRQPALRELVRTGAQGMKTVLLVEVMLSGEPTLEFIRYLLTEVSNLVIVVMATEMEQDKIAFFHEIGVKHCITKPISANDLLARLAAISTQPSQLSKYIDLGHKLIHDRQFTKALQLCDRVLEKKADVPGIVLIKGDALRGLDRPDEAIAQYELAAQSRELFLEPRKRLAALYRELGNRDKELECLVELDRMSPLNVERKVEIGNIHADAEDFDKAKEAYGAALKCAKLEGLERAKGVARDIAGHCKSSNPALAEYYLRMGFNSVSSVVAEENATNHNDLAIMLRRQGKWQEAVAEYQKALTAAPGDENILFNMAMAYVDGRDFRMAAHFIKKALAINPAFPRSHDSISCTMGFVFQKIGDLDQAEDLYRIALEINPGNERAKGFLSRIREGRAA